jgi:poly-gamma-glutamate synthesis protein (capsule biosynthesis protein)
MSRANNHAFDGGVMGMISTDEALDKLGIAHAGTGRNLQEARAAHYIETPKGRVGLVSVFSVDDSSEYGPNFVKTEATYRNGNLGGAPGLNPLHLTTYHVISPDQLQTLEQMALSVYGNRGNAVPALEGTDTERLKSCRNIRNPSGQRSQSKIMLV